MASNEKKKYNKMEIVLQYINKNFVTVNNEDSKKANPVLKHVIETIITSMKKVSPLFNSLYESVLYGGSYYDGLKVGKPEEFDIDLKLVLPKLVVPKLSLSNQPGFVTVQLTGWSNFEKSNEFNKYKGLAAFKDEKDYLVVNKVLQWIESVVNLAMNDIGKVGNNARIFYNGKYAEVAIKKSGPAMTALITYDDIYMDVDLVLVFKLTSDHWPPSPFRSLPTECNGKKEFLIVPKTPRQSVDKKERCWRMSFQEQEKMLIMRNNTCKPALRLIKKLRDTQNHKMISSYFIKTVFLHEIEKQDKQFWNSSQSFIFMHMLKTYRDHLENYKIPYYWNKNNNLVGHIDKTTIDNFKNYLNRVIDNVDKKIEEDSYVVAEYLCTTNEFAKLKQVNNSIKSYINKIQNNLCVTESQSVANSSCNNVDVVETLSTKKKHDNEINNAVILELLTDIQKTITDLQSNVKFIVLKVNILEQLALDVKSDNENIKDILRTLEINKKQPEEQTDLSQTNELSEKMESLCKSVEKIEIENNSLKSCLKDFVLSD